MMLEADALDQMIENAEYEVGEVCGRMPDFAHYSMDDGYSVVLMQESPLVSDHMCSPVLRTRSRL